jgi:hypothetical protein
MQQILVKCRGKTDILMDRMTDETLEVLRTGVRPDKPRDVPARSVAREKIYRETYNDGNGTPNGPIGFPQEMLFSCFVGAGRNVKHGKKLISTAKTTTLPDFLTILEPFLPLTNLNGKKSEDDYWTVDRRRGRLKDGTAVCIVRPRFKEWEFSFTLEYDEKKVDESVIRALVVNAGSTQGLGSFRPNCRGPFGRFEIVEWKKLSNGDGAPAPKKAKKS